VATKAEIRQRVAEDLSLVAIGQPIQSQDAARIDISYNEAYERLKEEGLAMWASTADVPDKVAAYYILLMEHNIARSYGTSDARYQRILPEAGPDGELALKRMARLLTPVYQSTESYQDY
jgi:hypothetical protein